MIATVLVLLFEKVEDDDGCREVEFNRMLNHETERTQLSLPRRPPNVDGSVDVTPDLQIDNDNTK